MSGAAGPAEGPTEEFDALSAQVSTMAQRAHSALDLIRGLPSSKEGRLSARELRAIVAGLRDARRDLVLLRRGLSSITTPVARTALLRQMERRFSTIRAQLARADVAIAVAASQAATNAPRMD